MRTLSITSLFLLFQVKLLAQAVCPNVPITDVVSNSIEVVSPTLNSALVCAGESISIVDKSGGTGSLFWYDISNGQLPTTGGTTNKNFTYTKAGNYCIFMETTIGGVKKYSYTNFRVVAPSPVVLEYANCSKGVVKLTIKADANQGNSFSQYGAYDVDWGDGTNSREVIQWSGDKTFSYAYKTEGTKKVVVKGRVQASETGCGLKAEKDIDPILTELYQPDLKRFEMQASGGATLTFIGQKGGYFEIFKKNSSGYTTTNVLGRNTVNQEQSYQIPTVSNSQTECFKVVMSDQCGVKFDSQDACTIPMTATAETGKNILKWVQYPQPTFFFGYGILKDDQNFDKSGLIKNNLKDISFTDTDDKNFNCTAPSCYQVTGTVNQNITYNDQGAIRESKLLVLSPKQCVSNNTTPPQDPLKDIFTTIEKGEVIILPNIPSDLNPTAINLYRSDNGASKLLQTLSTGINFKDPFKGDGKQCYKMSYVAGCNAESALSDEFCPIFLKAPSGGASWTEYEKFLIGERIVNYHLERVDANGIVLGPPLYSGLGLFDQVQSNDTEQSIFIRVRGESSKNRQTNSNIVKVEFPALVFVPDVFTPNGDGWNDNFTAKGLFLKKVEMVILDRWGNSIFSTSDINTGWDGTVNGSPAEDGTYAYTLRVEDNKGTLFEKIGNILLVR
jgi:gliding motility-associated-like protein